MIKYIEKSAKTQEQALALALEELGLERDDVTVEVLELPKSGFLGIGSSPAVLKIGYEAPDEPEEPSLEVKKESVKPEVPAPQAKKTEEPKKEKKPAQRKEPKQEKVVTEKPPVKEEVKREIMDFGDDTKNHIARFLEGLLDRMGNYKDIDIKMEDTERGVAVTLSGKGIGSIIGHRGETLDAIQHLTSFVVNNDVEERIRVTVDAEGYRKKREQSLINLAQKMADKVKKYKRSMTLEPMNSYERHIIHTALQDVPDVSTVSTGNEPVRRVVVMYKPSQDRVEEVEEEENYREWS
ncbi:MAG: KH domain-containing protein [Clostridiaceae bacterium]|nr:KH domain-containing protein [Clostridiaceae bacterium]